MLWSRLHCTKDSSAQDCRSAFESSGECTETETSSLFYTSCCCCRAVPEYAAAATRGDYTPAAKFGWASDDGSGDQVFGTQVDAGGGQLVRRRKFGKILKLQEAGLLAAFSQLPGDVQRDGMYRDIFDAKYFEATLEAKPFMATFDTNQPVNEGEVFRTVLPLFGMLLAACVQHRAELDV